MAKKKLSEEEINTEEVNKRVQSAYKAIQRTLKKNEVEIIVIPPMFPGMGFQIKIVDQKDAIEIEERKKKEEKKRLRKLKAEENKKKNNASGKTSKV